MGTAGALGALGAVGAAALMSRQLRRWRAAEDPCAGLPLDDLSDLSPTVMRLRAGDGTDLHVVTVGPGGADAGNGSGTGATFVLAHCWTGDSRTWGPVARRLVAAGHRAVVYDHRGHGRSDIGSAAVDLELLASDLHAVLDHVDAHNAVLAGHSLGGMTIQALAASADSISPGRVGAVVLVSTASALRLDPIVTRFGPRVVARERTSLAMVHPMLGLLGARRFFGTDPVHSHMLAAGETYGATDAATRSSILANLLAMDLAGSLARSELPVTVVVGQRDHFTPLRAARTIVESNPGARLVVVPDAGHMLPFERPDLLASLLLETATGIASHPTRTRSAS